jgi:hypothetical protein
MQCNFIDSCNNGINGEMAKLRCDREMNAPTNENLRVIIAHLEKYASTFRGFIEVLRIWIFWGS